MNKIRKKLILLLTIGNIVITFFCITCAAPQQNKGKKVKDLPSFDPLNYVFLIKTKSGKEKEFLNLMKSEYIKELKKNDCIKHFKLYVCDQNTAVNFATKRTDIIERDFIIYFELNHYTQMKGFLRVIADFRNHLYKFKDTNMKQSPFSDYFDFIDEFITIEAIEYTK